MLINEMFELKQEVLDVLCKYFIKNMTIYLNFYIITYLLTLIQIQYLLSKHLSTSVLHNSLPYLNFYINKFSKFKSIFFILFLSLSGLPPFFLFFIKFNLLINLFYKLNIFSAIIVFIIFFLNMLFYVQFFLNKNINYDVKIQKNNINNEIDLSAIFTIVFFCFMLVFSVFFFSDIYYILKMLYI